MSAPRPRIDDAAVVRAAAVALAPKIMEWGQSSGGIEDVTLSDIADDLVEAGRCYLNGYELAKRLERDSYTPDADLVEILERFWVEKRKAQAAAIKAWVVAEGLEPRFAVGAIVCVDGGECGPIVRVHADEAYYLVKLPSHAGRHPSGYLGTHIDYERAALLTERVPA